MKKYLISLILLILLSCATSRGAENLLGAMWGAESGLLYPTNLDAYIKTLRLSNLSYPPVLLAGVGGANTNFTLVMPTHGEVTINGFTNVSLRAIMGTDVGLAYYCQVLITNLSGSDRTLEFSTVTNRYRFYGCNGTNAPSVLTNNTALMLSIRTQGTNGQVGYAYFTAPL
jgi:hypothetical protein